ncbi:hypothetical protein RBA41_24765 [Massilia sp. CCM 9210]|uniref:hypothetical protein n=1 Tax=Massilia scottii TaxID=3057166 RepID=UPI0027967A2E|nr:hypothetical protein [Massilia sp. CCM 9210]MDQ1816515.1 hypothetical protein [Massilia sp. CCM 9210]
MRGVSLINFNRTNMHTDEKALQTPERTVNSVANLTLAAAIFLPRLANPGGQSHAQMAGKLFGVVLAAAIVLGALRFFLGKRPARQMVRAKFVVAFLLFLAGVGNVVGTHQDQAAMNSAQRQLLATMNQTGQQGSAPAPAPASEEARELVAFLDGLGAVLKRQMAEGERLEKEFGKISLDGLTPESFMSRKGIDAARIQIVRFRQLIEQRDTLAKASVEEGREYLRTARIPERYRNMQMSNVVRIGEKTLELNAELSAVQKEMIDGVGGLLDFAQSRLGKMQLHQQTLVFSSDAELATYQRLSAALDDAATREAAVIEKYNAHRQKIRNEANTSLSAGLR